jgi:eukaryotic-like serine/threonine-protein kinase
MTTFFHNDVRKSPNPKGAPASQEADPDLPGRLGSYEVLGKIGEGGMATVYKGRHPESGALVAIKLMSQAMAGNPVLCQRFEQEFQATNCLNHPGLVRGLDFGRCQEGPFFVMELVEGESLGDRIEREGPLPPPEAARIISRVGEALHYAHEMGVIHRDVKPDNVLLGPEGTVRLTDFGLAKHLGDDLDLTRPGQGLGTPSYIAPEQLKHAKGIDRRGDVYGLGATLYAAVTGQDPFSAPTQALTIRKKFNNDLTLPRQLVPTLGKALEQVICRAMHTDPGQRPASCLEFIDELARSVPAAPSAVSFPTPAESAPEPERCDLLARLRAPLRPEPEPVPPTEPDVSWVALLVGGVILVALLVAAFFFWR